LAFGGFLSLTIALFIEYILALSGAKKTGDVTEHFNSLPVVVQIPLMIIILPMVPFFIGVLFFYPFFSRKNYLLKIEFDMLLLYFSSIATFVLGVYTTQFNPDLSLYLFDGTPPKNISASIAYTFDIAMRGLFFDFFEHFRINISSIELPNSNVGRVLTYVLRFSSSAFAISIVIELVKATKQRLDKLEDEGGGS
jgi:hypothetical protein